MHKTSFFIIDFYFFCECRYKTLFFLFWKWECIYECTKTLFYFSTL